MEVLPKNKINGRGFHDQLKKAFLKGYQQTANTFIDLFGNNKSRHLEYGELHVPLHNFTGPGTNLSRYKHIDPYNDIDACSKEHDIEYNNIKNSDLSAAEKAQLIQLADEKAIECYDRNPHQWGYIPARLGMTAKNKAEKFYSYLMGRPSVFYGTSKFLNVDLYNKAKAEADRVYSKPSAYKSGFIVKKYKELGGEFSGIKPKKTKSGKLKKDSADSVPLARWFAEDWQNQKRRPGYEKKGDVYRPTRKITSKTPATYEELTTGQIKKAMKKKKKRGRVDKFAT
jgi:hypothetical protein